MAVTGTPLAGTRGAVKVGGQEILLSRWNARFSAREVPTTNFGGQGFTEQIVGPHTCEFECSGFWDAGANPNADPPNLRAGATIFGLNLELDRNNTAVLLPQATVLNVTISNDVEGRVEFTFSGKSDGSFYYPDTVPGNPGYER